MSNPPGARLRALSLAFALALAAAPAAAEPVRYWVPDNAWVRAMLYMMEGFGLISRLDPRSATGRGWHDAYDPQTLLSLRGLPWTGERFGAERWPAIPGRAGWPGYVAPGRIWPGGSGAYPPSNSGYRQDLGGLWTNPDGEVLLVDRGGFAYRDPAGRTLYGRLRQVSGRLLAQSTDGQVLGFDYRTDGARLLVRDPAGNTHRFVRVR